MIVNDSWAEVNYHIIDSPPFRMLKLVSGHKGAWVSHGALVSKQLPQCSFLIICWKYNRKLMLNSSKILSDVFKQNFQYKVAWIDNQIGGRKWLLEPINPSVHASRAIIVTVEFVPTFGHFAHIIYMDRQLQ